MISDYEQMVCYHYSLTDYQLCLKIDPKFFTFGGGKLAKCFELAKEYLTKYKTAPSEQDVVDMAKMRNLDDQLTENFIHTVYLSKDSYKESDPKWLYDRTTSWAKWQNTISHVIDTATYLRQVEDHLTLDSIDEKLERARSMLNTGLVLDFSDSENKGKHLWCAADHKQEKMKRRSTGYSFIDFCLGGGYWDGSLVVFVGQPKVGKSNFLCNLSAKSVTSGYNVAYISCELPEEMILSRIGSNMFGIPIASYDETAADEMVMSKRISQFRSRSVVQPGELYVKSYGTSTLTTVMLESDLLAEEERMSMELGRPFHFDVVYIDYINIMSNWRNPNSENTYMKIKQLAEDVKAVLSRAKKYDIQFTVKENLDVLADRYKDMEIDGLTIDKSEEPKLRQAVFDFIVENQSKLDPATFTVRKFGEIMKAVEDDYIVSSLSKQSSDVADYAYDEDDAEGWKSVAMDILNKADDGSDFAETKDGNGDDKKAVAAAMKKIKKNNPKLYKELLSDDDDDVDDKELTGTADSDNETETEEAEKALQSDMSLEDAEYLLLG